MRLFMFYVGGTFRNANVELHDVRFSVGETPEECHEDLRQQWWGDRESLHLDCWGEVAQADGYDIEIVPGDLETERAKLFFVNLGGYSPDEFAELHKNVLLVAADAKQAKRKALSLVAKWTLPHKDNLFEVEKLVDLSSAVGSYGRAIRLTPASGSKPFQFQCDYVPIA